MVNERDQVIGVMDKMEAHQKGVLHRAFSIFIFNQNGQILLQQRASSKYHSGDLWTNTCCSHPAPNESILEAANRRLQEEMGFSCPLIEIHEFIYHAKLNNELTEYEYDHILVGFYNDEVHPNSDEVRSYKWMNYNEFVQNCKEQPQTYTFWLRYILEHFPALFNNYIRI